MDPEMVAILTVMAGAFVIFVTILWLLLPFAVFGIKPLLREILYELRERDE